MKKKLAKVVMVAGIVGIVAGILIISSIIMQIQQIAAFGGKRHEKQSTTSTLENLPPWVTSEIIITCLEIQEKHGIYASVTIAQAQQEVGGTWNGTALYPVASIDYNLFGLKASSGSSIWNGEVTWDGTKGSTGTYRKYASYAQGLKDRARLLLTSGVYAAIADTAFKTSQAQLQALSNSPWCENQYNTLNSYMDLYQLTRLDTMTVDQYKNSATGGGGGSFNGTFVYYNQADPKWGSLPYVRGESIAASGCAATSLAMIWATYGKNMSITPATVFGIGNANGALASGWLSRDGCVNATNANATYGSTAVHTNNWIAAETAIRKGGAVMVVGTGNPPFTSGGHWFVIIGIEGNNAYLADPGHRSCTWAKIGGGSSGESLSYIKSRTQDMIIFTPR